ncbi:branched-chain amino acid ABC transporter permease [Pararobbsia silviterrae]|uniref:Branched-chain amino acid ABC transporter permease n=1 Tax=Pararobbsia silviterrae TaxID=1792498 RepID=A0A494Y7S7_9BURK|nr:branched-chain amino acid ABC transporter permease [Pararobbsia silviterrae]RKP58416.1 branched-chain amino acid ABC transporter permease [Pararobbsia silviterrae]
MLPNLEVVASSLVSGLLLGGMLALTALGLSIVLGVMKLVNLAHGEWLVAGAYLGYFATQYLGVDPLLALPLIAVAMGALALPFHRVLIRPLAGKGMEAPMMTMFGVSIILQNVYLLAFTADTRAIETTYAARPLHIGPATVSEIYLIGFAISVLLALAVHALITRTAFGRDLRAASADPSAAAVMGVDVGRVHALTFALGAACAAMGGVLIGTAFSFTPSTGATYLLISFAVVVMGGIGNIYGTLVAGIVLGVLQSIGALLFGDGYRDLVGLVLFLLVLTLRPQGLVKGVRS